MALTDLFDKAMISVGTIYRRAPQAQGTNYGQPGSTEPVVVETNVPCRVALAGGDREIKYDKKLGISYHKIFMRPRADMKIKDWIVVDGDTYNIISIENPSNLNHHWECKAELQIP